VLRAAGRGGLRARRSHGYMHPSLVPALVFLLSRSQCLGRRTTVCSSVRKASIGTTGQAIRVLSLSLSLSLCA
jgi:hypothetical protein